MKYGTLGSLSSGRKSLRIKVDKEGPNFGFYTPHGGRLENHEKGANPEGRLLCFEREFVEETGLMLRDARYRGTILFDNEGRTFPNWNHPDNFLVYVFSATSYLGSLKERCKEGVNLWVPDEEIITLPQNPGDRKMYEWLADPQQRRFTGVIRHEGNELDERNTWVDFF